LCNIVVSFSVFVDLAAQHSKGGAAALGGYEKAAAAFLFFDFCLSVLACVFATKAVDEARPS